MEYLSHQPLAVLERPTLVTPARFISPIFNLSRASAAREMRQCPDLQDVAVSVDTFYSGVAERAVAAGADVVNDVSGGRADPAMLPMVAEAGVPYVLMHSYGPPERMASGGEHLAGEEDVVGQIGAELGQMGEGVLRLEK